MLGVFGTYDCMCQCLFFLPVSKKLDEISSSLTLTYAFIWCTGMYIYKGKFFFIKGFNLNFYIYNPIYAYCYCFRLFEAFFQCSYNLIPASVRFQHCERKKEELRQTALDVAHVAANVNNDPKLINVSNCVG